MTTTTRAGFGRFANALTLILVTTLCLVARVAPAGQDEAARAREEIAAQLEELGTTLKAAVFSGALTGEEARGIYDRVVRAAKATYAEEFRGSKDAFDDDAPSAKGNAVRLFAPRPERIAVLLRAEFQRRDLPSLAGALDLDPDQHTIAKFLVEDYLDAFQLASTPLREALAQHRRVARSAFIVHVLEEADVQLGAAVETARRVDRAEAVARTTEALARIERDKADGLAGASDEERGRFESWKRRMINATGELDDRLDAIRDRATARLADLGRPDATITAEDLVRLAQQLRADRTQLRTDLVESLETLVTAEQRGEDDARFEGVFARVRVGQLLPRGRLGGESMDLWAALAETRRGAAAAGSADEALARADAMLRARTVRIAAGLDERTEATIDREIAGLEFQAARDRIAAASGESIFEVEERRLASAVRPYAAAARREIMASVAVRDALLAVLDECAASIGEGAPDTGLSIAYREAALRRGFPVETRQRWAERAIASALELAALDEGARETLRGVESGVAIELTTLRRAAIATRLARDPRLARDFIDSQLEGIDIEFDDDAWREPRHEAFAAIDDRVEGLLRGVLLTEQLERLPRRRGKEDAVEPGKNGTGRGKK